MKKLVILLICVLSVGCSPQKRLTRLIERYPCLIKTQTQLIYDTIITPEIAIRGKYYYQPGDTIHFADTNTSISGNIIIGDDTIALQIDKPKDTIIKPLKVEPIVIDKTIGSGSLSDFFKILFLLLLFYFLISRRRTTN